MRFELTILGCNSAIPAFNRFPTSQVLNINEHLYLIDCGECTQIQLSYYGFRKSRIKQIFISHLHGDHIYGLIGLLTSQDLMGRKDPIDIYTPKGLEEIINVQLKHSGGKLGYDLNFHFTNTELHQKIFEDKQVEVYSIPLKHRIPCAGFLFREKARPRNIIPEKIEEFNIPFHEIDGIKNGNDFIKEGGEVIPNLSITREPPKSRSYAYCSDTMFLESIIPIIKEVDLLYHETTYCHDLVEQAKLTMHTTAKQAAIIATKANVGKLITGHYSSRYKDLFPIIEEARAYFSNTELGLEGKSFSVDLIK